MTTANKKYKTKEEWSAHFARLRAIQQEKREERKLTGEPDPLRRKKKLLPKPRTPGTVTVKGGEPATKASFIWEAMAELTGGTEAEARMWYDAMCASIYHEISNHRSFRIPPVGTIRVYRTGPRKMWNPKEKVQYKCDAETKIDFRLEYEIDRDYFAPTNLRKVDFEKEKGVIAMEELC